MVARHEDPKKFFTPEEREKIVEAIRQAETLTSGEIRVYLERHSPKNHFGQAKKIFEKLGMTRTLQRNGVLIYFSLTDHRFVVLGDQGIHGKVGDALWNRVVSGMQEAFARGAFGEGLVSGIQKIGLELERYFPYKKDDVNELPDEIHE